MRRRSILLLVSTLLLSGCNEEQFQQQRAMNQQLQSNIAALSARVDQLELQPDLTFELKKRDFQIEEKMFSPVLRASAELNVSGRQVPKAFYVDLQLSITIKQENFRGTIHQVYWVRDGYTKLLLEHPLPVHGLSLDQIEVEFKPVSWYAGELIAGDQVRVTPANSAKPLSAE